MVNLVVAVAVVVVVVVVVLKSYTETGQNDCSSK